jgi:Ribonuclease P/MRP, subunit p29
VRRSKNAALVGASGIVVQETENTFKVVTRENKLKGARPTSLFRSLSHRTTFFLLQSYRSKARFLRSPSLCIIRSLLLLLLVVVPQSGVQTREVQAAAIAARATRRKRCSMAHISSLSCTVTNSVFVRQIGRGESLSIRRPSSCEGYSTSIDKPFNLSV